jgi:hypothetical protein
MAIINNNMMMAYASFSSTSPNGDMSMLLLLVELRCTSNTFVLILFIFGTRLRKGGAIFYVGILGGDFTFM